MQHARSSSWIPWLVSLGLAIAASSADARMLTPTKKWHGQATDPFRIEEMEKKAPSEPVITDKDDFARLWKAWMPNERIPAIDFTKELVIVTFRKGYIPADIFLIEEQGDVKVYESTGFSFVLGVFNREGLKTIMGKPITPSGVSGSSQIEHGTRPTGNSSKGSVLPVFREQLNGKNEVRVRNPNDFSVVVGVRSGLRGRDFEVPANGTASIYVPDGPYDVYFVYSTEPTALFQGDNFTLKGNGAEIQIVKVVGGNYGIRRVK